jgi:microcystin degradation protein MlrC
MRIAVGGFHHETNTFAPVKARFEDFERGDGWPALSRGEALFDAVEGVKLGISGFIDAGLREGHEPVPLSWCSAVPSAHVEEVAFERIAAMICDDLAEAGTLDGVYLDLHGAMVTEHLQDGEGALVARVREVIGTDVPLVVSLDLHANVTKQMIEHTDAMVAYRTYPHIDMIETGARALNLVERIQRDGAPHCAARKLDYLIPLVWQCTSIEPAKSIYARLESLEGEGSGDGLWSASFATGFPPADIRDVGPMVLAYGEKAAAEDVADALAKAVLDAEPAFAGKLYDPGEAVRYAVASAARPMVIADTQDNPGAGGNSDTVGMLRALLEHGAKDAVFGMVYDPDAAARAHAAGVGAEIDVGLGAGSAWEGEQPFEGRVTIVALGDGKFTATGPMFGGARMRLGPMAVLRIDGVDVVVSSRKIQCADQAMLRHVGIEPSARSILVLKSSVHFRADFEPIAGEVIIVASPGPNPVDHLALDYRNLRSGLRLTPLGPTY